MNNITKNSRHDLSTLRKNVKPMLNKDKLVLLNLFIEETEKYELLTTNQYLKHMVLVLDILDDITDSIQKDGQ